MFTPNTPLAQKIADRIGSERSPSMRKMAEGRSDVFRVNPFLIEVEEGFNAREIDAKETQEHIDHLAQSIAQIGVQRPLKVRNKGGKLLLKDGECRLRATIRAIEVYNAEIVTIPVLLAERSETEADSALGILVENSGLPLTPLAKATVVTRLKNFGWSNEEIAEKAGMSKGRVSQLLDMNGLGDGVKDMIRAGVISPTLALEMSRDNGWDDEKTAEDIKKAQTEVEARGKTKVTAKAVAKKPKASDVVADILAGVEVEADDGGEEGSEVVVITMDAAQWAAICSALKIENKAETE